MKKYLTILATGMFLSTTNANAQMPYKVTTQSQTYTPLTGATTINGTTAWTDSTSFKQALGFNFELGGKSFSNLSLLGINVLATDTTGKVSGISLMGTSLIDRGIVSGTSKSPIRYTTSGVAGKRIFKLEFLGAGFFDEQDIYSTLDDSLNLQVWLYEDSSIVELHFGPSKISHYNDYFSMGGPMLGYVRNLDRAASSFEKIYLLSGNPTSPTIDSATASSSSFPSLSSYPVSGTVYRFTPKKSTATGVNDVRSAAAIKVYPTVCTDKLFVENEKETTAYKIIALSGNITHSGTITNGRNAIDIRALPGGNYIIAVKNDIAYDIYKFVKQ